MSRHDTEQDQLETIKAWWDKYGTGLLSVILVIVLSFSGYRYWQGYTYNKAVEASSVFEVLDMSLATGVFGEVSREARRLMQDQPKSPYSGSAALMLADFHWQAGEIDEAIDALSWLVNSKQSADLKQIAQLRLARIYIQQADFVAAQQQLDLLHSQRLAPAVTANVDYVAGLLALAQKQTAQAYEMFKRVVENEQAQSDLRNLASIQMDDLAIE
ncbi:tetratricopeptide repeat protein [Thiomicrospira sp. R3]|uniref:YfgM family protein n=1 Tax=Thiomicrospira sp. R3 TaxID=3035472 RepID=UPI00259BABCE|nr:tetratricopeptide repeat protein [Thiomicrospira sp. R3]WFE69118.1 tetratricopeptide repeat protein [Thiomicrospira sp. R3]